MHYRKGHKANTRRVTQSEPPKFAVRLLKLFLRDELFEEVSGDMKERFDKNFREKSKTRAKLNYYYEAFAYLRPFAIRKVNAANPSLLQNNIKISWRHLRNQPMFSSINIGGLTLGITACILITLYIQHELSFDQHFAGKKQLYRLYWTNNNDGIQYRVSWNPPPLADALRQEVPEIENIARVNFGQGSGASANEIRRGSLADHTSLREHAEDRTDVNTENENYFEEGFIFADPQLIDVLNINTVQGNRKTALTEPMTMVITQRKAQKFFPNENPIGQLMIVGNDIANPYRIDAVVENPPAKSHLQYDFILTLTRHEFGPGEQHRWNSTGFYSTYLMLNENANVQEVTDKMRSVATKHMRGAWSDEFLKQFAFGLQPVKEIHLYSADIRGPVSKGDITYVWIFGVIAIFILVIACINFINLSTAKSANRAKEVGLRKTVGSSRAYIINQFFIESVIYSLISFSLGCLLAWMLLGEFNHIAGTSIEFPWSDWRFMPVAIAASVVLGVVAGLYPSFYLSSFRPIEVLKGNISRGSRNSMLRSSLVVLQFTTSIVLIIGTVVIYRQVDFMLNRKPGFEKEQVLLLHGSNSVSNPETLKQELLQLPNVQDVAISDFLPVTGNDVRRMGKPFWLAGEQQDAGTQVRAQRWSVDQDYIQTMGMRIVAGRDFDPNMISDSNAIIINQKMMKDLGLEDPIGKQIAEEKTWTVIGVVEDFNFESLRSNIRSLSMVLGKSPGVILVKIAPGDMVSTIGSIERTWQRFSPNQSIRYTFLDDNFSKMYDDVRRTGNIFTSFAVLALIVACLGLFALSAFMIEQRGKEISIRLLFGATIQKIFSLLTADFLKLVLISIVLSLPIAAWMAKQWLEGFHYRIELTWEVFVLTGAAAIGVALMTVSYQSIRAGFAKPVDKFRSD
jgi:putative ABC transport system permease protein